MIPRLRPDIEVNRARSDQSVANALVEPKFAGLPNVQLANGRLRERGDVGDACGDFAKRDGRGPCPVSPPETLGVFHAVHAQRVHVRKEVMQGEWGTGYKSDSPYGGVLTEVSEFEISSRRVKLHAQLDRVCVPE